jgi:hypothetical protein
MLHGMSEVLPLKPSLFDPSDARAYFEQRLFVASPFGTFTTAAILFAAIFGLFFAAAESDHVQLFVRDAKGIHIESALRMAFTLDLMMCAALFIQRYTRLQDRKDRDAFAAVLRPGALERRNLTALTPGDARLTTFTIIGLVVGALSCWPLFGASMLSAAHPAYATLAWFCVFNTLLVMAFVRGVELSRSGSRASAQAIDQDLIVDLLRIDLLSVWGRSAARFALIWFTVSAVGCLFFIGNGLSAMAISMVATFFALGIWMFVRPMERVHQKIRAAKAMELERVRGEIDHVRLDASANADAAIRLQGLLAYETRIVAAPEWPFDQTTLFRVGASALILTIPWFGQAVAGFVIERLA